MTEIVVVEADADAAWRRAVDAVRDGGVVVVPTDTVYGIACDAFNQNATARIFEIKRRPRSLALPVLVSSPRQAWALCSSVPPASAELAAAFWPGALTLVLPRSRDLVWDLGDQADAVAVRMPAHEGLMSLVQAVGPVAATSANVSGEQTPATVEEIAGRLGDGVALYVDGGRARGDRGSTIVDLSGPEPVLVREGPIAGAEIERVLGRPCIRLVV